jgi:hypothetical protein
MMERQRKSPLASTPVLEKRGVVAWNVASGKPDAS